MAETTAAFDRTAFDFSFDIIDAIPELLRISVMVPRVQAGQAVTITAFIVDRTTTFGKSYAFDPGELPEITLYKPDNTVLLSATDMIPIRTGQYIHRQQTLITDPVGAYTAVFTAVNGSMAMRSRKHVVYVLMAP